MSTTPKKRGRPKKSTQEHDEFIGDDFEGPVRGMTERQQIKLLTKGNTPLFPDSPSESSSSEEVIQKPVKPVKPVKVAKQTPPPPKPQTPPPKKQKEMYSVPISCRGEPMGLISICPQKPLDPKLIKSFSQQSINLDKLISLDKLQKIKPSSLTLFVLEAEDVEKWKRIYSNLERDNVAGMATTTNSALLLLIPQTDPIVKFFAWSDKEKLLGAIFMLDKKECVLLNKKKEPAVIVPEPKKEVLVEPKEKIEKPIENVEVKAQMFTQVPVMQSVPSPSFYSPPSYSPLSNVTHPPIYKEEIKYNVQAPPPRYDAPVMRNPYEVDPHYQQSRYPPQMSPYSIPRYDAPPIRYEDTRSHNPYIFNRIPERIPEPYMEKERFDGPPQRQRYESQRYSPPREKFARREPSRHLWVGRFPHNYHMDRHLMRKEYESFGQIESLNLLKDQRCAFVNFVREQDAVACKNALTGTQYYPKIEYQQRTDKK